MSRLLFLAAAICIAYCQSNSMPSVTVTTPTPASTSVAPRTTSAPAPTPVPTTGPPSPVVPTEKNYFINNTDGTVCMHLQGGFNLMFNYIASEGSKNETKYLWVDFEKAKVESSGTCNATAHMADLKLSVTEQHPYVLNMVFDGVKDKDNPMMWNISKVTVDFTFDTAVFKNYVGPEITPGVISKVASNRLLEQNDVALNQSFLCNANRTIGFPEVTANLKFTLSVKELRVQAFQFINSTTGEFDSPGPSVCVEDNAGNKVVPIAVGAALAGLVIVVLIAYLIGRLRNRRKSTYEALS